MKSKHISTYLCIGMIVVLVIFILFRNRLPFSNVFPYFVVLLCPLSMLFMAKTMGGDCSMNSNKKMEKPAADEPKKSLLKKK